MAFYGVNALSGRLLLVVMDKQKSNLSCDFKFELIIIYHIWFYCKNIVKMLQT